MKQNNNILLIAPEKLKRDSYLDANLDDNTLRVSIRAVQDIIIEDVLGTCLFDYIKGLICDNHIDDPHYCMYKGLLDDYIAQIFIYGVPAEINIPLSYKTRNSGTIRVEDDSKSNPGLSELQYTHNWYLKKRDFYISRAVDYIKCNSECFGLCKCGLCPCGCGKPGLKKKYSVGLVIDGGRINRRI